MKLCLTAENGLFDRAFLRRAAACDLGETELWLLLALAADPSLLEDFSASADALAEELGLARGDLDTALGFLMGAGLVTRERGSGRNKPAAKPTKKVETERETAPTRRAEISELPKYTTEELTAILERRRELAILIDEAQNALGKIFNQTEIRQLVALSEGLGLDDEYILLLFAYCRRQEKNTIRYAEKLAVSFYDAGITTPDALSEQLHHLEMAASVEGQIKRLFGFSRSLTGKEKGFVADWTGRYGFSPEMIEKGFEIAAESTANPNLSYLNSILTRWFEEGIKTPEDADRDREARKAATESKPADGKGARAGKPAASSQATSFNVDDFFAVAIGKGYGNPDGDNGKK